MRDTRDEEGGYKGNTGGGDTHWYADVGRAGVVRDGIRGAGSEHSWGELRRTGLHKHARITMVPTMSRWPPVGGQPAMVVAIKVQLGRAQERSAWEGGVKGARMSSLSAVSCCLVLLASCFSVLCRFCLMRHGQG